MERCQVFSFKKLGLAYQWSFGGTWIHPFLSITKIEFKVKHWSRDSSFTEGILVIMNNVKNNQRRLSSTSLTMQRFRRISCWSIDFSHRIENEAQNVLIASYSFQIMRRRTNLHQYRRKVWGHTYSWLSFFKTLARQR